MLCWSPVAPVKVTFVGHQEGIHGEGRRNTIWNRKWQLSQKLNNTNTMQSWVCLSVNIITVYRLINTYVGVIAGEELVLVWVSDCPITDDTQLMGPITLNCKVLIVMWCQPVKAMWDLTNLSQAILGSVTLWLYQTRVTLNQTTSNQFMLSALLSHAFIVNGTFLL